MVRVYQHFINNKTEIDSGFYNAGFENISILDIAKRIKKIPSEINILSSNDPRSYRQNSDKLLSTGFIQKYNVDDAINEIISKYNDGKLKDEENFYNLKIMKKKFLTKIIYEFEKIIK